MLYLNVLIWICRCFQRVWCFFFLLYCFCWGWKLVYIEGSRCNIDMKVNQTKGSNWTYKCDKVELHVYETSMRIIGRKGWMVGLLKQLRLSPYFYVLFENTYSEYINRIRMAITFVILLFECKKKRISVFRCYQKENRVSFLAINAFILFYFYFERNFLKILWKNWIYIFFCHGYSFHSGVMLYTVFFAVVLSHFFQMLFFILCL